MAVPTGKRIPVGLGPAAQPALFPRSAPRVLKELTTHGWRRFRGTADTSYCFKEEPDDKVSAFWKEVDCLECLRRRVESLALTIQRAKAQLEG